MRNVVHGARLAGLAIDIVAARVLEPRLAMQLALAHVIVTCYLHHLQLALVHQKA